jgi:nicotinate-nucleotide pyrophosphorylase (carboxylating)
MIGTRQQQLEEALFRGDSLTLENPDYLREVQELTGTLLRSDLAPKDLTAEALAIRNEPVHAVIMARERGVVAGLAEFGLLMEAAGVTVHFEKKDGDTFEAGDILLRLEGDQNVLLSHERAGLNLLQRMSGIATLTRNLQRRVEAECPSTRVVATRKTLWGWLDKRAVHVGGGGTHRLGLGDAILIKNNHLALIARREEDAAPVAIARAWNFRREAAFIEVEVRSEAAALAAAETFRRLQKESAERYPCLLLLDNLAPTEISTILHTLRERRFWDYTLVEASGGISENNVEAYADTGVDAISMGALTHSARSLDLCQKISTVHFCNQRGGHRVKHGSVTGSF